MLRTTPLSPSCYVRAPWKNGRGVTTDIAGSYRGAAHAESSGAWEATIFRLGRTAIREAGPFSDLAGFERWQVVVEGRGLVLDTTAGEVDLREPYRPAHYPGEAPIAARLEAGPVEVVNLIVDRKFAAGALAVLQAGAVARPSTGLHILYSPAAAVVMRLDGETWRLEPDHALRIEADAPFALAVESGRIVLASMRLLGAPSR